MPRPYNKNKLIDYFKLIEKKMFKNFRFNHNLFPNLDLFAWMNREKRQAQQLALEAETYVRQLNGLTTTTEEGEIISVLNSTCLLLRRLVERGEFSQPSSNVSDEVIPTPTEETPQPSTASTSVPPIESEAELSNAIKELIKLRDWVLLAKKTKTEGSPEVLSAIYQKLGQILEQEGVRAIEETGSFNYERQQIIATQVTNDPEQDDCIYDTIRPGYLFQGKLIRPQEAIVYTFQSEDERP